MTTTTAKKPFGDLMVGAVVELINVFAKIAVAWAGASVIVHGAVFFPHIIDYFQGQLQIAGPDSWYARIFVRPAPAVIFLLIIFLGASLIFTGARTRLIKDTPTWAQFKAQLKENNTPKKEKETVNATTPGDTDPKAQG